jgi:hypothetical protein
VIAELREPQAMRNTRRVRAYANPLFLQTSVSASAQHGQADDRIHPNFALSARKMIMYHWVAERPYLPAQ